MNEIKATDYDKSEKGNSIEKGVWQQEEAGLKRGYNELQNDDSQLSGEENSGDSSAEQRDWKK